MSVRKQEQPRSPVTTASRRVIEHMLGEFKRVLEDRDAANARLARFAETIRFLLDGLPASVEFTRLDGPTDIVMLFVTERAVLEANMPSAADAIFPGGAIWVAWPKKASKVITDVTGDTVRDVVLPMGLVDNKVCAIDEVWSGLRVVWRKELRT